MAVECFPSAAIGVLPCWQCVELELHAAEQVQDNSQASVTRGSIQCRARAVPLLPRVSCSRWLCLLLRTRWYCLLSVGVGVLPCWQCVECQLDAVEQVQSNAQAPGTRGNTVEQERCPTVSLSNDSRWLCLLLRTRWQCFSSAAIGVLWCWQCVQCELHATDQVQGHAQAWGPRGTNEEQEEQEQCSTVSLDLMVDGCVCCCVCDGSASTSKALVYCGVGSAFSSSCTRFNQLTTMLRPQQRAVPTQSNTDEESSAQSCLSSF